MEIQIKVPEWVNTDDEGICMLFAFLRRIAVEYDLTDKALDVYGSDIRRILDREENNIHEVILDNVDTKLCRIAKLNREHFVFYMKHIRTGVKIVTLKKHSSHVRWAYLIGCTNHNLLEPDSKSIDQEGGRPYYTPMSRLDREIWGFTGRGTYER